MKAVTCNYSIDIQDTASDDVGNNTSGIRCAKSGPKQRRQLRSSVAVLLGFFHEPHEHYNAYIGLKLIKFTSLSY